MPSLCKLVMILSATTFGVSATYDLREIVNVFEKALVKRLNAVDNHELPAIHFQDAEAGMIHFYRVRVSFNVTHTNHETSDRISVDIGAAIRASYFVHGGYMHPVYSPEANIRIEVVVWYSEEYGYATQLARHRASRSRKLYGMPDDVGDETVKASIAEMLKAIETFMLALVNETTWKLNSDRMSPIIGG